MSGNHEIQCRLALSFVEGVTASVLTEMEERGVSPVDFFSLPMQRLSAALGLRPGCGFQDVLRQEAMHRACQELEFTDIHNIRVLSWYDDDYPVRLRQIPDAPVVLYVLGGFDLNCEHMLSVVGTRRCTAYGQTYCQSLIGELKDSIPDTCIVSGLAYGIDSAAHSAALESGMSTVAVVAHGLHMIYPAGHRDLASRIIRSGGAIISEYPHGSAPYRGRFIERNRIVAALSDATLVVESEIKGGAMSTANLALNYNREVFALPGRISDTASSGCNHLIRSDRAVMAGSLSEMIAHMGWSPIETAVRQKERTLFPELEGDEKLIYDALRYQSRAITTDELHQLTSLPMPRLMPMLSELEFDGVIARQPGNKYIIVM